MEVREWPVIGVILAVLWLFVRGVDLQLAIIVGEFIIGLLVGLPIAFVFRRFYSSTIDLSRSLRVIPEATYYTLVFIWEVIVSGIDMAKRVLHPNLLIEPDVLEVPLRVQSDMGITSIANSISLTPGTLTMDHDPETNTLYIHGVAGRNREATLAPIRRWEDMLLIIFDEEFDPDDPPPAQPKQRAPAARVPGAAGSDGISDDHGN